MVDAVTARWHGDNYQSRIFWENVFNLLIPDSCVVEVTFEANGPKAFDDVVVRYDPAVARTGSGRITAEYHQVKWHVETGGRFGYEDLANPEFIGAKTKSLLQRLQEAKSTAAEGARFAFLTTYRIRDDDPLRLVISGVDRSILLNKLFDGTGPRSKMGRIRQRWCEHLGVDDTSLRELLDGFRILEGHRSLDELRTEINFRASAVGLLTCDASLSDFRYDELARQLKVRGLNAITRAVLEDLCAEEKLFVGPVAPHDYPLSIAIRSFLGPAADLMVARPENTLLLTDSFEQRYLAEGRDWQIDIQPRVEAFLRNAASRSRRIRLTLDAHASIAFLAGSIFDLKSGLDVDLIQKGRVAEQLWRADDGRSGPSPVVERATRSQGPGIALLIGITHDVRPHAMAYIENALPDIGEVIHVSPAGGPGPRAIAGGQHAADMADATAHAIRGARGLDERPIHVFAACPNALLYFLGQHHRAIAPVIVYEFDFDRQGDKTYHPSFAMR